MRVTLVHPAGYNFVPGQPDVTVIANRMAPIGILSLASWLDKHGHTSFVHDALGPKQPVGPEANAEKVLATNPEIVGFSATTSGFPDAYAMASYIKRKRPHVLTVFGNVHVSALGGSLLESYPDIDVLCIGEGEGPILDLADGKALKDVANICYRDQDRVVTNPRRTRIFKLDDLPFPAYEKLEGFPKGYYLPLFSYVKRYGATMITSRGCPYTCSFCDRTVFERLYKYNSPQYVWDHMKYLRDKFDVHHINIYDDLFTAHRKRVIELCDLLTKKPLGMNFNCAIRVGHDDLAMMKMLKDAGALMVSLGIESADPGMMERHKTGVTLDGVRDCVKIIHEAGLRAKGLFIMGMPGETPETLRTTSDFIMSLDLDEMNLTKFSPFHGAPMWSECKSGDEGTFTEDWKKMNCLNFVYVPKGFKSSQEMDQLYNWHVQRFFTSKPYIKRMKKNLWAHRWSWWHLIKNLPAFLMARRYFTPDFKQLPGLAPKAQLPPGALETPKPASVALPVLQAEHSHDHAHAAKPAPEGLVQLGAPPPQPPGTDSSPRVQP